MKRYIDLTVTVDDTTPSPPPTTRRLEVPPNPRGPGFWQVSTVDQSLHTGADIDSPLHGRTNRTEGAPGRFFAAVD
jgi:arylformamidase